MNSVAHIHTTLRLMSSRFEKALYTIGLMPTRNLTLPDFLGIGATKCGTTWLAENLRKHAGVFLCREKEVEFFDLNFSRTVRYYAGKFRDGVGKVKGEISPSYCLLPLKRIRFIHKIMPEVRLIFLIRNPIERAWSHAVMNLVKSKGCRVEDVDESTFFDYFTRSALHRQGGYLGVIERWLSVFREDQLFIATLEMIKMEPQRVLAEIFTHIGVSLQVDWKFFPFADTIVPPVGPEYAGHDIHRGVKVENYRSSENFLPNKYRDFLEKMYSLEIKELNRRFANLGVHWT